MKNELNIDGFHWTPSTDASSTEVNAIVDDFRTVLTKCRKLGKITGNIAFDYQGKSLDLLAPVTAGVGA